MQAKKALGQNFLHDQKIIDNILDLLKVSENDLIIEIGPGRGALTNKLTRLSSKLLCIEIDTDMHAYLDKYESDNCHIIYNDILNVDLKSFLGNYSFNNLYVIGNLPYYITSPILEHLIESKINAKEMYFMVQNEVAQRYTACAGHKEYGYMTIFINHYYDAKYQMFVSKNCFNPIPKVDSAVITLTRKENVSHLDEQKYFAFLKNAFSHKRKTLKNNLGNDVFQKVLNVLLDNGYSQSVRAEQLSEDIFIKMFDKL